MSAVASKSHAAVTTAKVVLFWAIAAVLVIAADRTISPISPGGGAAVKVCAMIVIAFVYMRVVEPEATLDHALFVGATWLLLAILGEIAVTAHSGHGWFELLGSPTSALRNVLMIAWVAVPALFARRH